MTKHIIYLLLLLLCSSTLMVAQNNAIFNGGSKDGYDKGCYTQASNLNTTLSQGGNGDGHSKDCYTQTTNLNMTMSAGGSGDGHSKDCYTQTSNLNMTMSAGGSGDGHSKDCYTQASNLNTIFSGGVGGDGQLNGCANEPLGCFLAINLGNDTTFCDGQTLTLNAGVFPGGATYEWQDSSSAQTFLVDTTGIYYVFVTDTAGCTGIDSIVITVNPMPTVDLGNDTAFCAGNNIILNAGNTGATYLWQNTATPPFQNQTLTVNTTGIYFVTASFGTCSDTDSITVTVNPIVTTNLPDSIICQGDSALIFGVYQTVAGTYRDTVLASTGCDSILVQQLIVNPTYNQNLGTVSICNGDSALILGNYETVAGVYSDTLTSINGCDSIVTQTLNVNPSHLFNLGNDTAFCAGSSITLDAGAGAGSYQWMNGIGFPYNQQTYTVNATGTYYVVATLGACTTSDTINVTVNPIVTTNLTNETVCQGDSALIFGTYQTIAGTYYDTLTASTNCDSILVKQLIVNPAYNQNLGTVSICAGDSALIFGNYETIAGVYYDSTTTVNGCDSITEQTLAVLTNTSVSLGNDTAICQGQSVVLNAGAGGSTYQWMGGIGFPYNQQTFTVNTTGSYYVEVTTGTCYATDTINVTINPNQSTNLVDSIVCQGDSALIFGTYQSIAGIYYDTLTTYLSCDSILVQQLIVNPTYNQNLGTVSICAGDSVLIFGNYQTIPGTYIDTLQSINGCDSIISQTLNIDATPVVTLGNDTTFCSGNSLILDAGAGATSYQWMSGSTSGFLQQTFTVNVTGTYYVTATIGVCSATDSIDVTVIQPVFTNYIDSIVCQGDSALIFGNYQSIAGNYYDTLSSVITGCDSILVQQLIVNPTYNNNLGTISICVGDSVLIFGNYQTIPGTYIDTLQSINGCDSIISQTLNIDATPVVTLGNDTAFCVGNSLILDAGAGATSYQWMSGSTSGFLQQTFTVNVTGTYYVTATIGVCSATDTINVTVIQPIFTNLTNASVCQGDSSLIFGNYQSIAGNYYDTLMAASTGCDSILVQQLIVNPNVSTNATATICNGDSILLGGAYQNTSGSYYDTLQTQAGCDSLVITLLNVTNGFTTNWADTICEGESLFVGGAFQIVTGIYYDSLQAINGCDSLVITNLLVSPKPTVIATASPSYIVAGESAQLNATGGGTYQWSPLNNLTCGTCENPVASPLETTIYTVTVDSNGCIASDTTLVEVDSEFKIPEGFSPNGDGVNDLFEIVGIAKYPNNNIIIINRWGNKVFEAAPYKSNWDGTSQFGITIGEKLPSGTYFYILDLGKENPSGKQEIKGYIYINR